MSILVKMIAKNPPSLMIVAGFLLVAMGFSTHEQGLIDIGTWTITGGFILQVLWLFLRR